VRALVICLVAPGAAGWAQAPGPAPGNVDFKRAAVGTPAGSNQLPAPAESSDACRPIYGWHQSARLALRHSSQLLFQRNYTMIEVGFPNTMAAIEEKKIVLAGLPLPFSAVAAKSGKFRTLFTMRDAMGPVQLTFLAMHGLPLYFAGSRTVARSVPTIVMPVNPPASAAAR
jgi:hypothetical protein